MVWSCGGSWCGAILSLQHARGLECGVVDGEEEEGGDTGGEEDEEVLEVDDAVTQTHSHTEVCLQGKLVKTK